MEDINTVICRIIDKNYDIGRITKIERIPIGSVNESYSIWTDLSGEQKRWFLRYYVFNKPESEIDYELDLMVHLRKKGFTLNACAILTKDGRTHVQEPVDGQERFFAVQEWLDGEQLYDWYECCCKTKEVRSVARVAAQIHALAYDFEPKNGWNAKALPIDEYMTEVPEKLRYWIDGIHRANHKEHFAQYMSGKLPDLVNWINRINPKLLNSQNLPRICIHTDLHPGNFKFIEEEVVSIFDFDWAKKDFRLYDVAFMLTTFATSWFKFDNGAHYMNKLEAMLDAYNAEMKKMDCPLGALNDAEWEMLPDMMIICNIFMLQESVRQLHDFPERNHFEYLYYMVHCINACDWIDMNHDAILKLRKD